MKITSLLLAVASARQPSSVFQYWGKQAHTGAASKTLWGAPINGEDILGNEYSRNAGSAVDYPTGMHTANSEFGAHVTPSNCAALHSSAMGKGMCLIGDKCGPCPVAKTAFPTPVPTPAPTVAVPNMCVRTGRSGNIIEAVPFGWSGVGADNKYCILEQCKACKNPTRRSGAYSDQLYCDMAAHEGMKGIGACGKHKNTDDCEYASCTYSPSQGMKVTHAQGGRSKGMFPQNGPFLTGDKHECRASHDQSGSWTCTCKCRTSKAAQEQTPKCFKIPLDAKYCTYYKGLKFWDHFWTLKSDFDKYGLKKNMEIHFQKKSGGFIYGPYKLGGAHRGPDQTQCERLNQCQGQQPAVCQQKFGASNGGAAPNAQGVSFMHLAPGQSIAGKGIGIGDYMLVGDCQ